jgi:hypothetical protein
MKFLLHKDKEENGKVSPQPNEVSSRILLNINLSMSKSKSVAAHPCNRPFSATHMLFFASAHRDYDFNLVN